MVWPRNWQGPDLEDILLISLGKMTFYGSKHLGIDDMVKRGDTC